jgi:hypothetical protein
MQVPQDRVERIRKEKERMKKIQELEILEEETQRAIVDKAKERGGNGEASKRWTFEEYGRSWKEVNIIIS